MMKRIMSPSSQSTPASIYFSATSDKNLEWKEMIKNAEMTNFLFENVTTLPLSEMTGFLWQTGFEEDHQNETLSIFLNNRDDSTWYGDILVKSSFLENW